MTQRQNILNHKKKFEYWFCRVHEHAPGNNRKLMQENFELHKILIVDLKITAEIFYNIPKTSELRQLFEQLEQASEFKLRSDEMKEKLRMSCNLYLEFMRWYINKNVIM